MRLHAITLAAIALLAAAAAEAEPRTATSYQQPAPGPLAVDIQQQDLSAAHLSEQPLATLTGPLEVHLPFEARIPEGDIIFKLPPHETVTGPLHVRIPD
jgi:hypothetical protein